MSTFNIIPNLWRGKKRKILVLCCLLVIAITSCRKLVEVPPPTSSITEINAFSNDATAIAIFNSLYGKMNARPFQGNQGISIFAGLSADEFTLFNGITSAAHVAYYKNQLSTNIASFSSSDIWLAIYPFIYKCNAAIEGLNVSTTINPIVKQQLLGEAKFMRAFYYFYLTNLYGDVPLALITDIKVNTLLARSSQLDVYKQIILDLEDAKNLLSSNYLTGTLLANTFERVRPTKWAAIAMLARTYLFIGDWTKAEIEADQIISNSSMFNLTVLNSTFLKNGQEAIWQIQPTALNFNTQEAIALIIPSTGPGLTNAINPGFLSKSFLGNFEAGDKRALFGNWIDTTIYKISSSPLLWDTVAYANKYKLNSLDTTINATTSTTNMKEYYMVLRVAEQYLIRAEARARNGNLGAAITDIDKIRQRAGLTLIATANPGITQSSLLDAILHERQVELFTEWGHRWLDLKRTGKVDNVMTFTTPIKANGAAWQSYQQLYPIPVETINAAPNVTQNAGY